MGWNRYRGNDPRPNAGMTVAFMVLSALRAPMFYASSDRPVGVLFTGLFFVYFFDLPVSLGVAAADRALGLVRGLTGLWLMYLTFAVTVDFALTWIWPT